MRTVRLKWQFFWSRRSRLRISMALLSLALAIATVVDLLLPFRFQQQFKDDLTGILRKIDPPVTLGILATFLSIFGLILIFAPGYRRKSYLATSLSIIPPISVYVDAENQLKDKKLRPFVKYLMAHLDGRRADLLYFLDASKTATNSQYKELYRHGFRPIDVPHDPTGQQRVKEAVDKELSMHAYERALLGPPNQEFIIITGDQDFVQLVYRLIALGHRVQIWATPIRAAYKTLATYLDVALLDLSEIILELPETILEEDQLTKTIEDMFKHIATIQGKSINNERKNSIFRGYLGGSISAIGYNVGNRIDFWLEHLHAVGVLNFGNSTLPTRGEVGSEAGARFVLQMAQAAAEVTKQLAASHTSGVIRTEEIADALLANATHYFPHKSNPLLHLLQSTVTKRSAHARYFIRCARALELINFEDVTESIDLIKVVS